MSARILIVAVTLVLLGAGCARGTPTVRPPEDVATKPVITRTTAETALPAPPLAASWKSYVDPKCGYSLELPADWVVGHLDKEVTTFADPKTIKSLKDFQDRGIVGEPGPGYDFSVGCWPTFRDFAVKNGYADSPAKNLKDLLTDANANTGDMFAIGETVLNGQSAVDFTLTGLYATYEVLFDRGSICKLSFPDFEKRSQLTPNLQRVLSSFRFTR